MKKANAEPQRHGRYGNVYGNFPLLENRSNSACTDFKRIRSPKESDAVSKTS